MKTSVAPTLSAGLLVLACFGISGCEPANEFVPPPPPPVTVQMPVVKEVTTYTEFTGRTEAVDTVDIRARVKGFLQSVEFEPGEMVEADDPAAKERGDLLFTIEPAPFQAAVAAADASLAQQTAARDLAKVMLDRREQRHARGAVTDLELAEHQAKLDAAEGAVKAAEAQLETSRIDLSYTKIYAPISGRISRERVDVGNLVGAGESTLLTTIVQDDPIFAYVEISERDLLRYTAKGRPKEREAEERTRVLLRTADGVTYDHEGVVDFAENRVDPATGTLQIRATFPNPGGRLFPGLFVRVLAPNETGEQILVPEVALLRDLAGAYVLVADERNVVQRRDVRLGTQVEMDRIITSGLEPGERVIVNGIQRAILGNPVDPRTSEADASPGGEAVPGEGDEPDGDSTRG